MNGTAGTWLEMDEGNQFCKGHPGMHTIPAALAFAVLGVTTIFVEPAWGITSFVIAVLVGLTPLFRR